MFLCPTYVIVLVNSTVQQIVWGVNIVIRGDFEYLCNFMNQYSISFLGITTIKFWVSYIYLTCSKA